MLAGCGATDLEARRALAGNLAAGRGWQLETIAVPPFRLATWHGPMRGPVLTVYLEGDGFAWATPSRPSFNPTPGDPVALKLALAHDDGSATYLARPCQYTDLADQPACNGRLWTRDRFGEVVVDAMDSAVTLLKARFRATSLVLVGYSGGGAVAVLVAARRDDVARVITIAAPLDHELWTREKRLTPLAGSLNPADVWQAVANVPQVHYVGSVDEVVPPRIAESYRSRFPPGSPVKIITVAGYDHDCCWSTAWPNLPGSE